MIQLQNSIRDRIQEELNKNTQGLDFEVSLYNVKTNNLLENTEQVGNTYARRQKRFIPVLIENISGEYSDLQNLTAAEANLNLSFMIPTDSQDFNNMAVDETFNKVSIALDEMRQRILAQNLPLGEVRYVLPKTFRLKALNNTETYNANYIELITSFKGDVGNVLTDGDDFTVTKTANSLIFFAPNNVFEYNIEEDKEYSIYIYFVENDEMQIAISDGSNVTTETIQNITYNPEDITLGGVYMEAKRWTVGGISGGVISEELQIDDFKTLIPTIGTPSLVDTSLAKFVVQKGTIGTVVFGMGISNPSTNQVTFGNGLNYQLFELDMDAFITDSVFVGNDVEYYLDDVRIYPVFRDEPFASETDASQVVSDQITRHTAVQSVLSREYSIFFKQDLKLLELAEKITSETPNPNEVFDFRVVYPLFEREYKVIITQGAMGVANNQPISISIKLDLASTSIQ